MLGFATLLWLGLTLYALLDVALGDAAAQRLLSKPVWVVVVLLVPVFGAIAWLVLGRPRGAAPARGGWPTASRSTPTDDPRADHPSRGVGSDPRTRRRGESPAAGPGVRRGPTPKGPDDDPEFLRALDERLRRRGDES
jgi:hypothetical protein